MSRAIVVRVSESVVRTIHVEDGVQSPLELLPVLPAERMAELLAVELAAQGFVRDGDLARRTDADGVDVTVDLRAATVTVKLGAGERVGEEVELSERAYRGRERVEEELRDAAIAELERRLAEKAEAMRREVTEKLERKLGDLKAELDGAIGRATVASLTERAAQLGAIQEVVTDDAGNVTIKVKL